MIERFTKAERAFHWVNAAAVLFLGATGLSIWAHLARLKWHGIEVVQTAHFWLGGGLLVLCALAFLLLRKRRVARPERRFNAGQRFNLIAFQVLLGYMVFSGTIAQFGRALGLDRPTRHLVLQTHLYSAMAIGILVVGHLVMVFLVPKNRGIVWAMLRGKADRTVLERSAPQWLGALEEPGEVAKRPPIGSPLS